MKLFYNNAYEGKTVLVTGNTGFKGSWLCLWLRELGAEVVGYSLPAPTEPNHFSLLGLDYETVIADVRNLEQVVGVFERVRPEAVFHLAAQPIVRYSYESPVETMQTNVMGTVNVLEACRRMPGIKALVSITSDKCYENHEWAWGYREVDRLGGDDPYSASKACAEMIISAYRRSYLSGEGGRTRVASVRAGNVIGGGDWAADRLLPDIMRCAGKGETVQIRNPNATRPWQHVLEPLSGYLWLGSRLLAGEDGYADAWNFGPASEDVMSVRDVAELIQGIWGAARCEFRAAVGQFHENTLLKLDISKAQAFLEWRPLWRMKQAIEKTVLWYRDFYENSRDSMLTHSLDDLGEYVERAMKDGSSWAVE